MASHPVQLPRASIPAMRTSRPSAGRARARACCARTRSTLGSAPAWPTRRAAAPSTANERSRACRSARLEAALAQQPPVVFAAREHRLMERPAALAELVIEPSFQLAELAVLHAAACGGGVDA